MNKYIEQIKIIGKIEINDSIFSIKSSIIQDNKNYINSIINWIEESINKKITKFELIFKNRENGTESNDFHKFCDKKGPSFVLIKTIKNKIFGGFTPINWDKIGNGTKDKNAQTFIFSLNLM